MKCLSCDKKHPRRLGMVCECGQHFVFDPKADFYFSDRWFQSLLERASAKGTRFYTREQLRSTFLIMQAERLERRSGARVFALIGFLVLFLAGLAKVPGLAAIGMLMLVAGLFVKVTTWRMCRRRPSNDELDAWIARWATRYGAPPGLVTAPTLGDDPPSPAERDVFDYGVAHLLIVDAPLLVDVLVRNGWADEQRCLVIAETGYPSFARSLAARFLEEQPELVVWLYHGLGRAKGQMEADLRAAGWPLGAHEVRDLGLFDEHFWRSAFGRTHYPRSSPAEIPSDIIPPTALATGLTAGLAAAAAFAPMLAQTSGDAALSIDSDFG